MATIKFLLQEPYQKQSKQDQQEFRPKKLNPNETRLYCFLIVDREHVIKIKTEYKILPKTWDFDKQGKIERLAGSIEFNKELAVLKESIYEKYKALLKQYPDITFKQLSDKLKEFGRTKEIPMLDNSKDFFEVLDLYIKFLKGEVADRTIKKFVTLKNSLESFGKYNEKYETLTFSLIDHKFLDEYRKYLRSQKARGRQKRRPEDDQNGLLLATQGKYIECLKAFCKWAEDREYNRYSYYKEFSPIPKADTKRKKSDHEIVALTLSELRKFYTHKFQADQEDLAKVRDIFCFGCFTGQRWGDISQFERSQLHGDVWKFNADKTKKETEIDLTGFAAPALEILKNYDYKLPQFSSQKFNKYLKDAAAAAEINEETKIIRYVNSNQIVIKGPKSYFLSSHSARRSAVSIMLNDLNLNPVIVMGITGHTDLKTLQKYIAKDRTARREAMSKTKAITELLTVVKNQEAV